MKRTLAIENLKTIDQIFNEKLSFLRYSTQKRNLAYKLQYHGFMTGLANNYRLYGSVKGIYIQQFVILCSTICECLLFCYLRQSGFEFTRNNQLKNIKFQKLIHSARAGLNKNPMISKNLCKQLTDLNKYRNLLHPERQEELTLNKFSIDVANKATEVVKDLIQELKYDYYKVPF